jgi:hypothetical protein
LQICSTCSKCTSGYYAKELCSPRQDTQCKKCSLPYCPHSDEFNGNFGPVTGCSGEEQLEESVRCGYSGESYGETCSANHYRLRSRIRLPDSWELPENSTTQPIPSDYMAFDVSHDRSVYAYGFRNTIRSYAYTSNSVAGKGMFVEARLPGSFMVITDIRFSPRDGSVYASVQHSDVVYRCNPECPDGMYENPYGRYYCINPVATNTWLSRSLVVSCNEWMQPDAPSETRLAPPEQGYSVQGGCQVFDPARALLLCASGTYRPPESMLDSTRVWILNTGMLYSDPQKT